MLALSEVHLLRQLGEARGAIVTARDVIADLDRDYRKLSDEQVHRTLRYLAATLEAAERRAALRHVQEAA